MKIDKELEERKKQNIWDTNLEEVFNFLKKATSGSYHDHNREWTLVRNSSCKYIDIRIDMRDGGFILKDREGNRISLEQLMYQYKSGDENDSDFKG